MPASTSSTSNWSSDPDKLIDIIAALEPTLGGVNLEDIKAPECFYIEKKLRERMNIRVFHDDQRGTAIISSAALLNGLELVGKKIGDVKLAVSGAGAAAIACLDVMVGLGVQRNNIFRCDSKGVVREGREDFNAGKLDESKHRCCQRTEARTLAGVVQGADVFLGCSAAGVLSAEMVLSMADKPIILALANPEPDIRPELAKAARPDCIIATGRSDYPNQVNNVLCLPYIFRGALDCEADAMLCGLVGRGYPPENTLSGSANLLVLPNLDAANILVNVLKMTGGHGVTVGPIVLGAAKPAHIVTRSATVLRIVNMTALAVADGVVNSAEG